MPIQKEFCCNEILKNASIENTGNLFRIIKENNDAYFPQFSSAGIISLPKYLSIVFHFVMYCAKIYAITKTLSDVEFLSCITRKVYLLLCLTYQGAKSSLLIAY